MNQLANLEQQALDFDAPLPPPPTPAQLGRAGRDEGIVRAATATDALAPGWGVRALAYVERFANTGTVFTVPDVRAVAYAEGLEAPSSHMAWGSVFLRAARAGMIQQAGMAEYGDATMHTQLIRKWIGKART